MTDPLHQELLGPGREAVGRSGELFGHGRSARAPRPAADRPNA
ncbi:hypothetical protein [Streptomyces sp. STR69]|nr:hypothetical protein [Streptomyces sp. STR69]